MEDLEQVLRTMEPEVPPYEWATQTDYVSNYSFVLPFENNWDRLGVFPWHRYYGTKLAYWTAALYVLSIWPLQWIVARIYRSQFRTRRSFELRLPLTLFNASLAVFSALGFVRLTPELFRVLSRYGFAHSVCVSSFTQDQVALTWIKLFGWSKYVELIDTLFLILRRRPVTFLHWYHHASVLVFTWHGMHTVTAAGRWFAAVNYGIHALMYTYFAWRSYGYGCPRWVAMAITSLQLSQMVVGCCVGYAVFRIKVDGTLWCHHTWENLYVAVGIYSTYLWLFAKYFYSTYLRKGVATGKTASAVLASMPCCVDSVDDGRSTDEAKKSAVKKTSTEDNNYVKNTTRHQNHEGLRSRGLRAT